MSDIADVIKLVNKETEREDLSEEIKQYLFCDLRHKLWKMDTIMPDGTFRTKEYSMPDGRTAVFEYDHNGVGKITLESMDMLMGLFAEKPQGEWIPCSERQPIREGHYLCSFKKPKCIDNIYVGLAYWTGGRWYGYLAPEIKAWMSLPEPWKGADDETDRR